MIPILYSFRNLLRRPDQSFFLIIGSTLVITLVMTAAAMNEAMKETLAKTGDSLNAILLGAGSEESVERSEVKLGTNEIIASSIPHIDQTMAQPSVSPEIHYNGLIRLPNGKGSQILIRGVKYEALWVHKSVRIIEGHFPKTGQIMVGKLAHQKLNIDAMKLQIGETVVINGEDLVICGIFDAIGTVMESEVWMPLQDLMTQTQRNTLSCVVVRTNNMSDFGDIDAFAKKRLDLELVAIRESDYYNKLSIFYAPIRWMAWVCAILLSTGALLGGLNAMYASYSSRTKEYGAMQAIGFTRLKILISLIQESCLYAIIAFVIAVLVVVFFIQGISVPFSFGVFKLVFDSTILFIGVLTALCLGILGGLPPSWKVLFATLHKTLR